MLESPIDIGKFWLFAYYGKEPVYHGNTTVHPFDLSDRLRRLETLNPETIKIDIE